MFKRISEWLDDVLENAVETGISGEVIAFGFNLYDEDWLCNEVTDFGTREEPFRWCQKGEWKEILSDMICILKEYLNGGEYADVLKEKSGIGAGFVDGDVEILYTK